MASARWLYLAAVVLGLSGGVRQGTPLLLFPLWLWAAWRAPWKPRVIAVFLGGLAVTVWLGPMLAAAGGWNVYHTAVQDLWNTHHGQESLFQIGPRALALHVPLLVQFTLLATGLGLFSLILPILEWAREHGWNLWRRPKAQFFALWIAPPLAFYASTLVLPFNHGEILIVLPGLVLGIAGGLHTAAARLAARTARADRWMARGYRAAPALLAALNAALFLGLPSPVSASTLAAQGRAVEALCDGLRDHFSPTDTVIIAPAEFKYLGYRHVMYYLPEYRTYLARPTSLHEGVRYFGGQFGQTELRPRLWLPRGTRYIVCLTPVWPLAGRPADVPVLTLADGGPLPYLPVSRAREMFPDCEFEKK